MEPGKQVANNATERRKRIEYRKSVVEKVKKNLIKHRALNKVSISLYELARLAETLEEKVNASAKTEAEYNSLMEAEVAKAKKMFTNTSATGTDANIDWQEDVYKRLQLLKEKYYPLVHAIHKKLCKGLQAESSTQVLNKGDLKKFRYHRSGIEDLFSLFELSKSQITTDMKDQASKVDDYVQLLLKIFMKPNKQDSPDVQSKQQSNTFIQDHRVAMPIGSSQRGIINPPSIVKGPGNAVEQKTNISLQGFGVSNNAPRISETEAFGKHADTQRISPLKEESNNQNQDSQKPTLGSEELCPEMQRLIKVITSMSPEAPSAAVGDIEKVVRLNDEIPTFISPEGWKMPRSFVTTTFDTPGVCASIGEGFNQFTDVAAPELDSFKMKGKCPPAVENQNILAEIKDINNRLFDSEVVIAENEIVESVVGVAAEHSEGLLVKIMYNAVSINQNLVSHFTSDKKSLIKPLRLLIPESYPSSSLVILDELPLTVSDDLRALFERAKAKLRLKLQSTKQPWLIKDVARAWEHCAREAILDYAHANGGGTFTSMYGGWEACR